MKKRKQAAATRLISSIAIGERFRKDFGDIADLARSIEQNGLLHPVVITPKGLLIAGARRLLALESLGVKRCPVRVIDLEKIAAGEHAENVDRKDFTYAEAHAIAEALRPIEAAAAKDRQRQAGGSRPGKRGGGRNRLSQVAPSEKGKAADRAAKAAGKRARTMAKVAQVMESHRETGLFGDLVERFSDPDVKVDRVWKEWKRRLKRLLYDAIAEKGGKQVDLAALAASGKRFPVIYADPPWQFKVWGTLGKGDAGGLAEDHYSTMSVADICALPVAPLAAKDCTLFLWCVWPELPGALEVIKAWGFEYKTAAFVWAKQTRSGKGWFFGMGHWTRANTEMCILATRGNPARIDEHVEQLVVAPIGRHSEKPAEARKRIEQLVVGPYLELFARAPVEGWTSWGNELEVPVREAAE